MCSLKREWHIITAYCNFYFGTICITIVIASTFIGQSDQMRCQNVRSYMIVNSLQPRICADVVKLEIGMPFL